MTKVEFLINDQGIHGFKVQGHSSFDCDDFEGKLVCSAVSSAVYLVANTIIEIIGDSCETDVSDANMMIDVINPSSKSVTVLEGLKLHLSELSLQYPENIKIISEV